MRKNTTPAPTKSFWVQNTTLCLVLIPLLTLLFYAPIFNNEFINFDDNKLIYENRIVTQGSHISLEEIWRYQKFQAHYKPLVMLSWNLEYRLWQDNATPYHTINLLYHLLNSLLVFLILKKLLQRFHLSEERTALIALFSALIFSLHPMAVESVAWATERKDVQFGFFFLLSTLLYIYYLENKSIRYLTFTSITFLLGLWSKSPTITFFPLLFLLDYLYDRKIDKRYLLEKIPFAILFFWALYFYGILTNFSGQAVGLTGGVIATSSTEVASNLQGLPTLYQRLLIISFRFIFWIAHLLVPAKLALSYPREPFIEMVGMAIHLLPWISASIIGSVYYFRKNKMVVFSILFFVFAISPALAIADKGTGIFIADRYTYIPRIGLFALIPYLISNYTLKHKQVVFLLAVLVLLSGYSTLQRVKIWRTSETLFLDLVQKYPNQVPVAYNNLGLYYKDMEAYDKAIHYYTIATRISNYYQAFNNLANIYFITGKYREAIPYYGKALTFNPTATELYSNRGACYFQLGINDSALLNFNKAIELNKNAVDALKNRALLHMQQNNLDLALQDFEHILRLVPKDHEVMNARGVALQRKGLHKEAIENINRAIALYGKNATYFSNRSVSWLHLKEYNKAYQDILVAREMGLQVNPLYISNLEGMITQEKR